MASPGITARRRHRGGLFRLCCKPLSGFLLPMTQPKLWTIEFHHRHGVTFFVVASEAKPTEDDVELFLESEDGYEKDREDEYFTVEEAQVVSPEQFTEIVSTQKDTNDA